MKIFKGFNPKGPPCPICHTTDDKECTLLPIAGTNNGTMNYEAKAVHIACLDLLYYPASNVSTAADIIVQKIGDNDE